MDAPLPAIEIEGMRKFSGEKLTITFANDKSYEIEREIAMMSVTIQNMLGYEDATMVIIPKDDISDEVMNKVIGYCRYHYIHDKPPRVEEEWEKYLSEYRKNKNVNPLDTIEKWDLDFFVGDIFTNPPSLEKQHEIFQFIFQVDIVADYLDIKQLTSTCSKILAKILTGKNPEQMRIVTGFKNDFTPEEDEENMKIYRHFDV